MSGPRREQLLASWVGVLMLAPVLAVATGARRPASLYAEYQLKSAVAAALALASLIALRPWRRPLAVPRARAARIAVVAALALAGVYLVTALVHANEPLQTFAEAAARVLLPLAFAAAAWRSVPLAPAVIAALRTTALVLAALALLDLSNVGELLLPTQVHPAATLVHRNNLAFHLAVALPLFVARARSAEARDWPRALGELALVALALVGCRARTAWIGAALGCLALAASGRAPSLAARRGLVRAAGALALLALGGSLIGALRRAHGLEPVAERVAHAFDLGDPAMRERYDIYRDTARLIAARPFAGWGAGSFLLTRRAQQPLLEDPRAALIDPDWSYDAASDAVFFTTSAGAPGLFTVELRRPSVIRRVDGAPLLAQKPAVAPGGRVLAWHELGPTLSWERALSIYDRAAASPVPVAAVGSGEHVARAVFSHDGTRLAYELVHETPDGWRDELRVFDVASRIDRRLFYQPPVAARGVSWSADDRAIYTVSGRCLRRIDARGGGAYELACSDDPFQETGGLPEPPLLSPDGARVAMTVDRGGCPRVMVRPLDGGAWRAVGDECGDRPAWLLGPGVGRIAYVAWRGGARVVVSRSPDGGAQAEARVSAARIDRLAAAADGGVVALTEDAAGGRALWSAGFDGAPPIALAAPPVPRLVPPADHPHCELLAAAYEAGAGAAAALAVLLAALLALAARRLQAAERAAAAAVIVFVVLGTTNAPLALAPSATSFWLVAAALVTP